jgi:hypothetical protein
MDAAIACDVSRGNYIIIILAAMARCIILDCYLTIASIRAF